MLLISALFLYKLTSDQEGMRCPQADQRFCLCPPGYIVQNTLPHCSVPAQIQPTCQHTENINERAVAHLCTFCKCFTFLKPERPAAPLYSPNGSRTTYVHNLYHFLVAGLQSSATISPPVVLKQSGREQRHESEEQGLTAFLCGPIVLDQGSGKLDGTEKILESDGVVLVVLRPSLFVREEGDSDDSGLDTRSKEVFERQVLLRIRCRGYI